MRRVTVKPFLGIHTRYAEEDVPGQALLDVRNAALVTGELVGRLGGQKVNTANFGGPGMLIAQFVPRRDVAS